MNQQEVFLHVQACMREREPYLLEGPPGCAKTALVQLAADVVYGPPRVTAAQIGKNEFIEVEERPYLHVEHLADSDPSDLGGIPYVDKGELKRSRPFWMPPADVLAGHVFLDEIGQAVMAQQNVGMRFVREGRVGNWQLPPGWSRGAATNGTTHRSGVTQMNRALRGRFFSIVAVEVDPKQFRTFALKDGFHEDVVAFLGWQPAVTQAFDPEKLASPTCRGWDHISRGLKKGITIRNNEMEIFSGVIGEGVASQFCAFRRLRNDIVEPSEIIARPDKVKLPPSGDPSITHATCGALVGYLKEAKPEQLRSAIVYGRRLPAEFGLLLCRDLLALHKNVLLSLPELQAWLLDNKSLLN